MTKKIISIFFAMLICLSMAVTAFAASGTYVSFSDGIMIGESQIKELDRMAKKVKSSYDFQAYYYITDSIGDSSDVYEYAKLIYNEKASGMSGICFVAYLNADDENTDYSSEQTYLYVTDGAKALFTEEIQQEIYDAYDDSSTYFDAVKAYYNSVSAFLEKNSVKTAEIVKSGETVEVSEPLIKDRTGTISTVQREKLNEKLVAVSNDSKCNFYVSIVDSLDRMTADDYARELYTESGYGYGEKKDGVLLLLCFDKASGENSWAVYRSENVKEYYSDSTVQKLIKPITKKLKAKDYTGAVELYADSFGKQYGKHGSPSIIWLPVSFVIGFAVAFIVMKIRTANLKSVVAQHSANSYVMQDSIVSGHSRDVFIRKDVSKTAKASQSSNNNGSSSSGKF